MRLRRPAHDHPNSDIDLYVRRFADPGPDADDARARADELVRDCRRLLAPDSVDVRGSTG